MQQGGHGYGQGQIRPEEIDVIRRERQICRGLAAGRVWDQANCGGDNAKAARAEATPLSHRLPI
jgi:hypothetical protein